MNQDNEKTPDSPADQKHGPELIAVPSVAADRLYQVAALTAGIFFLFTLL
jgi:hypothetical protein